MAISFVGGSRILNAATSGSSDTQSFTTSSNANRGLIIGILCTGTGVSALNYAGVSCTQVGATTQPAGVFLYLFRLENPATGANNLVASVSSATYIEYAIVEYSGVNQTNMDDGKVNTNIASGSPLTLTATVGTANSWIVSVVRNESASTMTASTGVGATRLSGSTTQMSIGDSNATVGTGSQSQSWTTGSTSVHSFGTMMAIKEASGGASGPANLKSYNTNLKANIKSINTNLIANVKSLDTNV